MLSHGETAPFTFIEQIYEDGLFLQERDPKTSQTTPPSNLLTKNKAKTGRPTVTFLLEKDTKTGWTVFSYGDHLRCAQSGSSPFNLLTGKKTRVLNSRAAFDGGRFGVVPALISLPKKVHKQVTLLYILLIGKI